jgi:UDP-3-O-[3-hydroxymyristoyl] glucosamine N-acyltransferase
MIGAQSGIVGNIPEDGRYLGSPAMEAGLTKRVYATQKYMPEIYRAFMKAKKEDT